jgi:hypothetical protein
VCLRVHVCVCVCVCVHACVRVCKEWFRICLDLALGPPTSIMLKGETLTLLGHLDLTNLGLCTLHINI